MTFFDFHQGMLLQDALSASIFVYIASFFVKGEKMLRWSLLIIAWCFFSPVRPAVTDAVMLACYLNVSEFVYSSVMFLAGDEMDD